MDDNELTSMEWVSSVLGLEILSASNYIVDMK